ncbi:hypothetical protein FACS1894139_18640 [Planctomycetales bacterium]|nr:hypothetical protein FACS1894107_16170 [Planctomycetales bacterium]GHT01348.1 hypothetical protein FACS1894108_14970 [Planctomycetales bacterium]GHT08683.1 hypothetical protein FACS1894139_18640 [Planctomycetales bacterium]
MRKTIHLLLILAGVAVVAYALNRNSAVSSPARLQVFRGTIPAFGDELQLTVKLPPHRAEIFTRLKEDAAAAAEAIAQASNGFRQLPVGEMSPVEPTTWQLLQEARRLNALTADGAVGGDLLFQREGMKVGKGARTVDLDLLARGLTVDTAAALARKYGVADISVELGGIRRTVGEPRSETATATLGAFVDSGKPDAPNEKVATALDAAPPRVRDHSATATAVGDGATITVITRDNSVVAAGLARRIGALPDAERDAAATAAVQNFPASEVWLARENGETLKIN